MSDYVSGSNPWNDKYKSSPAGLPDSAFGSVSTPAEEVAQARPAYVIINPQSTGNSLAFNYKTSVAEGSAVGETAVGWVSASLAVTGSIRLDIQPKAWRQTNGTGVAGEVIFVYRGGLQ